MSALTLTRKLTVAFRRIPGTYPLLNAVRKHFYSTGVVTISDFDGTMRMELDLSEHMASQIFWFGYYSRDVLFVMDRLLRPGCTFFDIGANMGEVSLFAAKRVGETGSVLAFEPLPATAERLRTNLELNRLHNVEVIETAIGDRDCERPLYVSAGSIEDGSRHDGLGTLYATTQRAKLAGSVQLTTLDELVRSRGIERIDGVKLDIEGAELAALSGAKKTLARFKPWLIVEIGRDTCAAAGYEPRDIFEFLAPFGYEGFLIGRKGRLEPATRMQLQMWQNVLFTARDSSR